MQTPPNFLAFFVVAALRKSFATNNLLLARPFSADWGRFLAAGKTVERSAGPLVCLNLSNAYAVVPSPLTKAEQGQDEGSVFSFLSFSLVPLQKNEMACYPFCPLDTEIMSARTKNLSVTKGNLYPGLHII